MYALTVHVDRCQKPSEMARTDDVHGLSFRGKTLVIAMRVFGVRVRPCVACALAQMVSVKDAELGYGSG
jgi:hypothetical protein